MPVLTQRTDMMHNVQGVKALVYGRSGVGKTFLATTCMAPFVIATEPGLLSLRRYAIPFCIATTIEQLKEVARWMLSSAEARQYQTFFLDSLSEVLEIILAAERLRVGQKEPRKAYNELLIQALDLIRMFRDVQGPNVIFTAKQERTQDGDTGMMLYQPKFPGKQVGIEAPYFFDFVFQLHLWRDPQTQQEHHLFRCHPDNQYEAKDRSGLLNSIEPAHLHHIYQKVLGNGSA